MRKFVVFFKLCAITEQTVWGREKKQKKLQSSLNKIQEVV